MFRLTNPQACELSRAEMIASVPAFLDKLARYRPGFVCFVGMIIWEIVRNSLAKLLQQGAVKRMERGKRREKNQMGLQTYKLIHGNTRGRLRRHCLDSFTPMIYTHVHIAGLPQETLLFVVPCTSGRVVQYQVRSVSSCFPIS